MFSSICWFRSSSAAPSARCFFGRRRSCVDRRPHRRAALLMDRPLRAWIRASHVWFEHHMPRGSPGMVERRSAARGGARPEERGREEERGGEERKSNFQRRNELHGRFRDGGRLRGALLRSLAALAAGIRSRRAYDLDTALALASRAVARRRQRGRRPAAVRRLWPRRPPSASSRAPTRARASRPSSSGRVRGLDRGRSSSPRATPRYPTDGAKAVGGRARGRGGAVHFERFPPTASRRRLNRSCLMRPDRLPSTTRRWWRRARRCASRCCADEREAAVASRAAPPAARFGGAG